MKFICRKKKTYHGAPITAIFHGDISKGKKYMITAMVKLPDGKFLNKILVTDEELSEDDSCYYADRIIELANGVVALAFKDGTRVSTHMSNVVIIAKDSQ